MKKIKLLLLVFLLINILSALTGIKSLEMSPNETSILYYDGIQRVAPILSSLILAFFCYGIYQKKRITYHLGLLAFIVGYLYFIYEILVLYFEKGPTIVSIFMGLLAGSCFFFYIVKWWVRNKSYFFEGDSSSSQ
jgi:hypothetical protein